MKEIKERSVINQIIGWIREAIVKILVTILLLLSFVVVGWRMYQNCDFQAMLKCANSGKSISICSNSCMNKIL